MCIHALTPPTPPLLPLHPPTQLHNILVARLKLLTKEPITLHKTVARSSRPLHIVATNTLKPHKVIKETIITVLNTYVTTLHQEDV